MKATHNIKINGVWIRAGEEYTPVQEAEVEQTVIEAVEEPKAEEPAEEKPKATSRRKTASESK